MNQKNVTIKIEKKEEYVSIVLTGDLEYGIIGDVKKELQSQNLDINNKYVINMKEVTNIDSTGFGMIVNFARKVSVKGNEIVIIVVDEFVRSLFSISQCDKVFPIVKTEAEASQILKGNWTGELSINDY